MVRWAITLVGFSLFGQTPQMQNEALRHFQALVRMDTQNPPGNETQAAEYLKRVLEAEGIPAKIVAKEPTRGNLIARLKGNGSKRPLLIMGHLDTVRVDPAKWTQFSPFSAARDGGYIYGRGTIDDKDNVTASLMTMLWLQRKNVPLDRDVIFVAEAGEEASTQFGIEYLINDHWSEIEAEICLAEGAEVLRRGGQARYATVQTAEKIPKALRLVARGPAGHGSRPLRNSAILHLTRAVERVGLWNTPVRLNDTTRHYFEKLGTISSPEAAARYAAILNPAKVDEIQDYLAENEPGHYSMLRTSVSPNIIRGGYQINVIPSEAEATLDVRALPDEDMDRFVELMRKVINDPQIEIVRENRNQRPGAPASRLNTVAYRAIERANRDVYNVATLPWMATGATDMAFLRAKGVQCYGVGVGRDEEDGPLGYGAHSDKERIVENELYQFVRFLWEVVNSLAAKQ